MNNCPVCDSGRLLTKIGSAGEETFCLNCRRIVVSASLGFVFTAAGDDGVKECSGPSEDPRPGFKGPGPKSKCHLYEPGNEETKKRAYEKAKNAAWVSQHKKKASTIVNATIFSLDPAGSNLVGIDTATEAKAAPVTLRSVGSNLVDTARKGLPRADSPVAVTAPSGIQNSGLSGTSQLASKRLATLIQEDMTRNNKDISPIMRKPMCTSCGTIHEGECKTDR